MYLRKLLPALALAIAACFISMGAAGVTADFTISKTSGCSPLVVSFTNTSTGSPVSYLWDFGNGNISTLANPGAIYVNPGNYTVKLYVWDAANNVDSMVKTGAISVLNNPLAGFRSNITGGCVPLSIQLTDTSLAGSGSLVSWQWDFGDGSTSNSQNPSHTYTSSGEYTVSLVVTNASGCKNTLVRTKMIKAVDKPQARLSSSSFNGCSLPFNVNFTDASLQTVPGKTTWYWDFGDGATSTLQNPSHSYTAFGSFNVKLKVTVEGVCADSTTYNSLVNVRDYQYDFKADRTKGCGLFYINFTNLTTPAPSWLTYNWDFGDGNGSTLINPTHVYTSPGNYTVKLKVTGVLDGCTQTITKTNYISIGTEPVAGFAETNPVSCAIPFNVAFSDSSVNAVSWLWDFGDGDTSTSRNPTHTYDSAAQFTVRLIVRNAQDCADTLIKPGLVDVRSPSAFFDSPDPKGCKNDNTILFFDQSTAAGNIIEYFWDFGDGDTSYDQNAFHSYSDTGTFDIKLRITTADSCVDSVVRPKYVQIGNKPRAEFTATPVDECIQDLIVVFDNTSDNYTPVPDSYIWEYGDGRTFTTTSATGPVRMYNVNPGQYTVRLIVFSNGCSDTMTRQNYITVHGPKANFTTFQSPCAEDSVYFNNLTLGGNKYLWRFGDGDSSSLRNPAHAYAPGNYTVRLEAYDTIRGCRNDTFMSLNVPDLSKRVPGFTASQVSGCYPISVNFTDTTQNVTGWEWDLGNGEISNQPNPATVYREPGYYTIKLTITDVDGCTRSVTRSNYIKAFGAKADFDICEAHECGAGGIRFRDFSYSPDPMSSRTWNFGDGATLTTTDTVVEHVYTLPTNQYNGYTVTLTVTDSANCTDARSAKVRLTKPVPFHVKNVQAVCGGFIYYFSAYDFDPQGVGPFTYQWKFAGSTLGGKNTSKFFNANGTYYYTLVYTDFYGCKDSLQDSVVIDIKTPKAGFTISDTFSTCPPLQVQFNDTSVLGNTPIVEWLWDFGDGTTSTLANPKKLYVLPGAYNVSLKITDGAGCVETATRTSVITVKGPTGTYSFDKNEGCDSLTVFFTSSSTNASNLNWDLGDGTIVNDSIFSHTYTAPGIYIPLLILSDTLGCTYSAPAFDTIRIWRSPTVKIGVSDTFLCDTGFVQFADLSTYPSKAVAWYWDLGDGTTSTEQSPMHNYNTYDTFSVSLRVIDSVGCTDSATMSKWVAVADQIVPKIAFSASQVCENTPIQFIDSSTALKSQIASRLWVFGDGDSSTAVSPVHTYTSAGNYTVRFRVVNDSGCIDSLSQMITVNARPAAGFTASVACNGDSTTFTDTSAGNGATIAAWKYYFGDGDTAITANPRHLYDTAGTYSVKLIITSAAGCQDSVIKNITVNPRPVPDFMAADVCGQDTTYFVNNTTLASGAISSYYWDFGDGDTSTQASPYHIYLTDGAYNVKLIATSDKGCQDSISKSVTVFFKPIANFTANERCQADSSIFSSSSTGAASYAWDFGDGGASTLPVAKHKYAIADTFAVRLIVTSSKGCKDTIEKQIIVPAMPDADFAYTTECYGNSTRFYDSATIVMGSIGSRVWDFGDGSTSGQKDPLHRYDSAGTYQVRLISISSIGCRDTVYKNVTVHPKPVAGFIASTACEGNATSFTDTTMLSSGSIASWAWDLGDGSTSALQNPVHLYSADGSYNVSLIVTTDKGCKDTISQNVTVNPKPRAGFTTSNTCRTDSAVFRDSSSIASGNIATYYWDFGDGDTAVSQNPKHLYTTAGTYNVILYVTSDKGCRDTASRSITIHPKPQPAFTAPDVCFRDTMFFVNGTTISTGAISNYLWDFGDGVTSTQAAPAHLYPSDGTYTVKLVATSDKGCRDSISTSVTVFFKPIANFTANERCQVDSSIFSSSSTGAASYAWDFGDGGASTLAVAKHKYAIADTFAVRLIVTSNKGCKDTIIKQVVIPPMPVADFAFTTECFENSTRFSDSSKIATGSVVARAWDFGDGTTSGQKDPLHRYDSAGTYTVRLIATSNTGCRDTVYRNVTVHPKPLAGFMTSTECYTNTTDFTDTSTVSKGSIVAWQWDFGDGGASTLQNPSHPYAAAGAYDVTLIVTTDKGCKDTVTLNTLVYPKPVAGFSLNNACLSDTVYVKDLSMLSTGSIIKYNWDFGDGATDTLKNTKHKYADTGTYAITLIIISDKGCGDTITKQVTIYPMPKAGFSAAPVCFQDTTRFTDNSSIGSGIVSGWSWDFGDGATSILQNPIHLYAAAGVYNVKLIATSGFGCRDTILQKVTVYPKPKADFSVADACKVDSLAFTDKSTVSSGYTVVAWNWTFGDGGSSQLQNPKHLYAAAGTYAVRLISATDKGCKDTIIQNVIVFPQPVPAFDFTVACYGNATTFQDKSTVSSGNITQWYWNLGDGTSANTANPAHTYAASGTYNVKLISWTDKGCKDSITQAVIVHPKPLAGFMATTECFRNDTRFTDTSKVSSGTVAVWDWDLGDGATASQQSPTHLYKAAGTYSVRLIVTTNNGCKDTANASVIVHPKPDADFTASDVCQVDTVFYTDKSTVSTGSIVRYEWDLGDGDTSLKRNPSHHYKLPGAYAVRLITTTDKGCSDTAIYNTIIHPMPKADMQAGPECAEQPLSFTDKSSVLTGNIVKWEWDFGDGQTSLVQNPVNTYAKDGAYTVKLKVTTSFGCQDSITRQVVIYPLPVSDYNFTVECVYDPVILTDRSTITSGSIKSWYWDFGDGQTSALADPRHLYATDGKYDVMLVTTSAFGCRDTITRSVEVLPKPFPGYMAAPVCLNDTTRFTDTTRINSGKIISWFWRFGDGSASSQQNPIHRYKTVDTFIVDLITVSDRGCTDSVKSIAVVHPLPVARFAVNTVCLNDTTRFTDHTTIASGKISKWKWDFGDGNTDTVQHAKHVYAIPGLFDVTLISFSSYGCSDTISWKAKVHPRPEPRYKAEAVCNRKITYFYDSSTILTGKIIRWDWDFGDGFVSNLVNPVHQYLKPGRYPARLTLLSDSGCVASLQQDVIVYELPEVDYAISSYCLDDNIQFTDLSTSVDGNIIAWEWGFGDGDSSTSPSPKHKFSKTGKYLVGLRVTTDLGCSRLYSRMVPIVDLHPAFSLSDPVGCIGKDIQFTDISTADTGIVRFLWDFGDGDTSTQHHPLHAYDRSGIFDVSLSITDSAGCTKVITKLRAVEILDDIPPAAPEVYRVSVEDDNTVSITYKPYIGADFAQYRLLRDDGSGAFNEVFRSTDRNDTSFNEGSLDTRANSYCYKLVVKDICDYETEIANSATHCTIDLAASAGTNKAVLNWTAYNGWKVAQYTIYREDVGIPGLWWPIASVPGDVTSYEDTGIICYRTHHYKVAATEDGGNQQLSYSDTAAARPIYVPDVKGNDIVRATVEDDAYVLIEWTPSPTRRPWLYILEKATDKNGPFSPVGAYSRNTFSAKDRKVQVDDTSYTYRMQVMDSCGDLSPYGNIAKTILLQVKESPTDGKPYLTWTPYKEWPQDVDYYEIQWFEDATGTWKTLAVHSMTDTSFTDKETYVNQAQYCYRIIGHSQADKAVFSISNVACLPTTMRVYVPNAFTPTGDLRNETFNAKGTFVFEYTMRVYNRWGELMYETQSLDEGWDGYYRDRPCQEGVYIYQIEAKGAGDQYYRKWGNITLLR